jgi:hypothetical protein
MTDVSLFRLYLLRAVYLLIGAGLLVQVWPRILWAQPERELMQGVVDCMLAALCVLALLGIRYPLRMLPVLLWELAWKSLWLIVVALPQWRAGTMDEGTAATAFACLVGVVVPLALPWRYLLERYLHAPGDRWSGPAPADRLQ